MVDVELVSNELLERMGRQSTEDFDLTELESKCQPHYDKIAQIVWSYTINHSEPATED